MNTAYKTPKYPLEKLLESPNIAEFMPQEYLDSLGKCVVDDTARDLSSRIDWEQRHADAIKLALQVKEVKSFPWTNCSNIKFPLLTIAVLQFLARISIMTKGQNLAKVQVLGADTDGLKYYQSQRLSRHLSLQLIEEDSNWRDSDEQAKFAACLLGSSFKKTYPDTVQGRNISEHVLSMDFVVDYKCKDIDKAQRLTHIIAMSGNTIQENHRRGVFLEMRDEVAPILQSESGVLQRAAQDAEGVRPTGNGTNDTYEVLEQHLWLDLDGDGYKEPYIATVRRDTAQVLRVVARYSDNGMIHRRNDAIVQQYENQARTVQDLQEQGRLERLAEQFQKAPDNHIVRIDPMLYFTRLLFIPSPDGGVYGLGLGALLGPMNEAVDTLTNQLVDAGTMSNTAGGFLGRGVKIKAGKNSFDPFEWKPVDSNGQDLRQNIFPLPVRDPSPVLFQLLGMLVTYSEKISGATDIMTGISPGQNTPAETSRNTVEQGMMLFSGIYARMYRSFTEELKKLLKLNQLFLPNYKSYFELTTGKDAILMPEDYDSKLRVLPAASPEAVSTTQRREKASVVLQLAQTTPGFNNYLVVKDFLEAYDVEGIDEKYPDPRGSKAVPPPPNLKMEELKFQQQKHQDEMQLAVVTLQKEVHLNEAKVAELQAKAAMELANAKGVDTGHQIALLNAQIAAEKNHNDKMRAALEILQRSTEHKDKMGIESTKQKQPQDVSATPATPVAQPQP